MDRELPSGAKLAGGLLPYGEAWAVSQTILNEIKRLNIDVSKIDVDAFSNVKLDAKFDRSHLELFLAIKDPLCALLGSSKIVEAVDHCFKKLTYNNLRIGGQTFESKEARQDYLFAAYYALWENVSPFFAGLSSSLQTN